MSERLTTVFVSLVATLVIGEGWGRPAGQQGVMRRPCWPSTSS